MPKERKENKKILTQEFLVLYEKIRNIEKILEEFRKQINLLRKEELTIIQKLTQELDQKKLEELKKILKKI